MKTIAMTGATGFVGDHLAKAFAKKGWKVVPLGRKCFAGDSDLLIESIKEADVVVNLAGAPIIGKWTPEYKAILRKSRIDLTRKLVAALKNLQSPPKLFISTSAIGYYKSNGAHTETNNQKDQGFLGELAGQWENEAIQAEKLGIRTIIFRFGVVLGKNGGALQQMLLPFKLGLGGQIGNGKQPFSWIHIEDLTRAYLAAIETESYAGIYNLTSPYPTTNFGLTKALGKALCRPTFFRVPNFILALKYGEGAQLLTSGQEVIPQRLIDSGFDFLFPKIEEALRDCVN